MLSAVRKKELNTLLSKLNIQTENFELFDEALTHPSFNFEQNITNSPDYERLEFLGDSVLRLAVSDLLFEKYKNFDEGKLTKVRSWLVSDCFLAQSAEKLGIAPFIKIGQHEDKDGGRQKESILACATEALFGAVYKSCGYSSAYDFIINIYRNYEINPEEIIYFHNSKELLQQYTQSKNKDLPEYKIIKESGLDHDKTYEVCVVYNGSELGRGCAKSKKDAEKNAALNALKKLNILKDNFNE